MEIISRRRGRPPGSIKVPPDLRAGIWNTVRLHRIGERIRTGKTPSARQACRKLAAKGGILSVVGGNLHALGGVDSRDSLLGANQIQGCFWGGSLSFFLPDRP